MRLLRVAINGVGRRIGGECDAGQGRPEPVVQLSPQAAALLLRAATMRSREACSSLESNVECRAAATGAASMPSARRSAAASSRSPVRNPSASCPAGAAIIGQRARSAPALAVRRQRRGSCRRARWRDRAAAERPYGRHDSEQPGIRRCELLAKPGHDSCWVCCGPRRAPRRRAAAAAAARVPPAGQQHCDDCRPADRAAEMNRSSSATNAPYATMTARTSNSQAKSRETTRRMSKQLDGG